MGTPRADRTNLLTTSMIPLWHTHRWVVASDAEAAQKLAEQRFPQQAVKIRQASSLALLFDDPYQLMKRDLQVCKPTPVGYSRPQIAAVTCFACFL